jgi:hypothetical protein
MPLYLEFGRVYLRLNEPEKARAALLYGRSHSSDPEFTRELANAWRAGGNWQQGAIVFFEGMVLDPGSAQLAAGLMELYRQSAPESCAIRQPASLNLECPLVHDHVCTASRNVASSYRQSGQPSKAASTAAAAIRDLGCGAELFQ